MKAAVKVFWKIVAKFVFYNAKFLGLTADLVASGDKKGGFSVEKSEQDGERGWFQKSGGRVLVISFVVLPLVLYPFSILAVKFSTHNVASLFSIFVIVTLYFHYIILVLALIFVVLRCRRKFSQTLAETLDNVNNISEWMDSRKHCDSFLAQIQIDSSNSKYRFFLLVSKCLVFETLFLILCWLNLNWSIIKLLNSIPMLLHSTVLIYPTVVLTILSNIFYATLSIIESLIKLFNEHLGRCMAIINASPGQQHHRALKAKPVKGHVPWTSSSMLWQSAISDNIDGIIQYYARTLQLLHQLNQFYAVPILLVVLNCFFNITVQLFSVYMTLSQQADAFSGGSCQIVLVNSVYIFINYVKLFLVIRTSKVCQNQVNLLILKLCFCLTS